MRTLISIRSWLVVAAATMLLFACQEDTALLNEDALEVPNSELIQRLETTLEFTEELEMAEGTIESRTHASVLEAVLKPK